MSQLQILYLQAWFPAAHMDKPNKKQDISMEDLRLDKHGGSVLWDFFFAVSNLDTFHKVDGIMKEDDDLQILQLYCKLTARCLKLRHN